MKTTKPTKQKFSRIMSLPVIRVGTKCNARCSFCNVPSESYNLPKERDINSIKEEISDLTEKYSDVAISLSGGEPTLRKDLPEIIRFAKQQGVRVVELQTNATLLSREGYVKLLKKNKLNRAFVSFHSHIPAQHDRALGIKNSFEKCIKGIKNLLEAKIIVTLNPVVTAETFRHLPEYLRFVRKEFPKIKYISLSIVQPNGRAWTNKNIVPRYGVISPYVKKALLLGKKLNFTIMNPYCGLPLCIGDWWKYPVQCMEISEKSFADHQNKIIETKIFSADGKTKASQCLLCDLEKYCNGVWRNYAAIHPLSDLKPVYLSSKQKKRFK